MNHSSEATIVKSARDRRRELIALASKRLFESMDHDEVNESGEGKDSGMDYLEDTPFHCAPSVVTGSKNVGVSYPLTRAMKDAAASLPTSLAHKQAISAALGAKERGDTTKRVGALSSESVCTARAPGAWLPSRPSTTLLGTPKCTVGVHEGGSGSSREQPHRIDSMSINDGLIRIEDGSTSCEGLSSTQEAFRSYSGSVFQASTESASGAPFTVARLQSGSQDDNWGGTRTPYPGLASAGAVPTALAEKDAAVSGSRMVNITDDEKQERARAITVQSERLQRRYFEKEGRVARSLSFRARSHSFNADIGQEGGARRGVRACKGEPNISADTIAMGAATSAGESGQGPHCFDDKPVCNEQTTVPHGVHSVNSTEHGASKENSSKLVPEAASSSFHVVSGGAADSKTGEAMTAACDRLRTSLDTASMMDTYGSQGEQHTRAVPGVSSNRNQLDSRHIPPQVTSIQRWGASGVAVADELFGKTSSSNPNRSTFADSFARYDVRGLESNCDSLPPKPGPCASARPAAERHISAAGVAGGSLSLEPSKQTMTTSRKSGVAEREYLPTKGVLFRNKPVHPVNIHSIPGKAISFGRIPGTPPLDTVAVSMRDSLTRGGLRGKQHYTGEATSHAAVSTTESREDPGKHGVMSEHFGIKYEGPVDRNSPEMPSSGGFNQLKVVEGRTLLSFSKENRDGDLVEEAEDSVDAGLGAHNSDASSSLDERFNSSVSMCEAQNPCTWFSRCPEKKD